MTVPVTTRHGDPFEAALAARCAPGGCARLVAMASSQLKWLDNSQPQTLQGAVLLSYINAFFGLLGLVTGAGVLALFLLIEGGAALAIANERRWGYYTAVVASVLYLCLEVLFLAFSVLSLSFSIWVLLNLAFAVVLVALLLHRQSREYQRVWFH
jgi:uncharacterized membrane protein (DUF2068 family)